MFRNRLQDIQQRARLTRIRCLADDLARLRFDPVTASALVQQIKADAVAIERVLQRSTRKRASRSHESPG
jgi:hypothetical protein